MKKMLIVYYSQAYGNTEKIALKLAEKTGADVVKLDTVVPYPKDQSVVISQGEREVEMGYEPEIQPVGYNVDNYDVIAVGTPTWWYTMASPVRTFMHNNNFENKTFIPFMTHAGWPGKVIKDMEKFAKGAHCQFAKEVKFSADRSCRDKMLTAEEEIDSWVNDVKDYL